MGKEMRFVVLFVLIWMSAGCLVRAEADPGSASSGTAQEVMLPRMSLEEYPRMDGSLACVPLCEALARKVTGCTQQEAEETMWAFTNTNPCYLKLAEGERDLLLVYEPSEETREELEEFPPLDMRPVGRDALVFLVSRDNPVTGLTMQEVTDIYTGKITNWSQVGGPDEEIVAYQRPENSGSQTLMRKLLLGDAEMAEAPSLVFSSMDEIIEALREYENGPAALGYSVYYYASEMMDTPELRFLAVEGVEPTNETIRSGEYPLVNDFYCVVNAQSSENAVRIRDWLLGEDGQAFVEECGYVPAG